MRSQTFYGRKLRIKIHLLPFVTAYYACPIYKVVFVAETIEFY